MWKCGSWPKMKCLGRFGLKIASYMLVMNILIEIDDLDWKLKSCETWSQNWNVFQLLWNLALRANRI